MPDPSAAARAASLGLIPLDAVLRPIEAAVEHYDDESLLLDPRTGFLCTLNPIGGALWDLTDGVRSLRDLAAVLADAFHIAADQTEQDVLAFAQRLLELGFAAIDPGAPPTPDGPSAPSASASGEPPLAGAWFGEIVRRLRDLRVAYLRDTPGREVPERPFGVENRDPATAYALLAALARAGTDVLIDYQAALGEVAAGAIAVGIGAVVAIEPDPRLRALGRSALAGPNPGNAVVVWAERAVPGELEAPLEVAARGGLGRRVAIVLGELSDLPACLRANGGTVEVAAAVRADGSAVVERAAGGQVLRYTRDTEDAAVAAFVDGA